MKAIGWRYAVVGGLFLAVFAALAAEGVVLTRLYQREHAQASARLSDPDAAGPSASQSSSVVPFDQSPFADLDRLAQQMRSQMRSAWSSWGGAPDLAMAGPRVDLSEKPDRYVLKVEEPGLPHEQVKIDARGHEVTLRFERQTTSAADGKGSGKSVERQESVQSFGLAHAVDSDHMKVEQEGNTMTVTLPKARQG